jgi:hypothetical protein
MDQRDIHTCHSQGGRLAGYMALWAGVLCIQAPRWGQTK